MVFLPLILINKQRKSQFSQTSFQEAPLIFEFSVNKSVTDFY